MLLFTISKALSEHAEPIQELLKQLGYASDLDTLSISLATEHSDSEIYVAIDAKGTIGVVSLIYYYYFPTQSRVCRITSLVVDENYRGKGAGSKLIQFAQQQAITQSCQQLEVTTSLLREKTQKYYEYLGFKKSSLRYILELTE